jgi:exodeoxyribonuclease III
VLELLAELQPDVVCMQETKFEVAAFPALELAAGGYDAVHHWPGRWAGVAIVARRELGEIAGVAVGLPGELRGDEARWIDATVTGMRVGSVYVPNGREVGSPTYDEKLAFLDAIAASVAALRETGEPLFAAGDFNVAPRTSTPTPPAPDEMHYTWWDYRQGHFHRGLGCASTSRSSAQHRRVARRVRHRAQLPQGLQAVGPRAARRRAG